MLRFFLFCLACSPIFLAAQNASTTLASGKYSKTNLNDILADLENKYQIRVCFEPEKLPWYRIDFEFNNKSLHETMTELLSNHYLTYITFNDSTIGVCRKTDVNADYLKKLKQNCAAGTIEKPEFLRPKEVSFKVGKPENQQVTVSLRLSIVDDVDKEPIIGATIFSNDKMIGNPTDEAGQTNIQIKSGHQIFTISSLGYRQTIATVDAWESGSLEIPLKNTPELLQEVEISGNAANNKLQNTQTAVEALPVSVIKELPSLMGEADVIKSLSHFPGITSAGEGASGFNVRGGNVDQNLILQDNAPLLSTSHVLGLFSVFNPDIVQNVTLYKGHIPARFGGRVASVLDVRLRDGDYSAFHGTVGVGLISGKVMLEGPILKNKISFIGGFRRSYSDWIVKRLYDKNIKHSSAWFGDGLLKVSGRLGSQGSIAVSVYQTSDFLRYSKIFGYRWSNQMLNFSMKNPLALGETTKIVSVLQGNLGKYTGEYFVPEGSDAFSLKNGLAYSNLNWRAVYTPGNQHEINTGLQWERIVGLDEKLEPIGDNSAVRPQSAAKDRGETFAFFAEDDVDFNEKWSVSGGVRVAYFRQFGAEKKYVYAENQPILTENIVDSLIYGKGKTVNGYLKFEPRFSAKYQIDEQRALKFSYNRIHQFVHQISNLASPTPVDIWQVSTSEIAPLQSDNFDIGFTSEWNEKRFEFSTDIYFKKTENVPVFRNFPDLLLNDHLETELVAGKNNSFGLETSFRKKIGRTTGWITYTFSKSKVQVNESFGAEKINLGEPFPSDYDQPHQVNALLKYARRPSVFFILNYVYRTGRPVTAPNGVYQVGNVVVPDYSRRNNFRIPDYHRFDFSMNVDQNRSKISGVKTTFAITIYNVLARKNPYSVFFQKKPTAPVSAYSLSLVGAAIPAANLIFTF